MLAVTTVRVVLTPAARTVSMDVRPAQPSTGPELALSTAEVPTEAVHTEVDEYPLTNDNPGGKKLLRATEEPVRGGGQSVTSDVLPVTGYGTVGVTWAPGTELHDDEIGVLGGARRRSRAPSRPWCSRTSWRRRRTP